MARRHAYATQITDRSGARGPCGHGDHDCSHWSRVGCRGVHCRFSPHGSSDRTARDRFYTAYDAALARDAAALPALVAFLSDRSGPIFMPQHSLDIEWPVALDFVWGVYGPEGYPVLVEIAAESGDPVMMESALVVLCTSEYPDALPVARRLAIDGETAGIRRAAVRLLGWHGRARDWERLLIGLVSDNVDDISASLWAIHKSGDERAVSYAIPFCEHPDPWIRDEALSILALACTPESIEAMHRVREDRLDDTDLDEFGLYAEAVLWMAGLDWTTYCAMPAAARKQLLPTSAVSFTGPDRAPLGCRVTRPLPWWHNGRKRAVSTAMVLRMWSTRLPRPSRAMTFTCYRNCGHPHTAGSRTRRCAMSPRWRASCRRWCGGIWPEKAPDVSSCCTVCSTTRVAGPVAGRLLRFGYLWCGDSINSAQLRQGRDRLVERP